MTEMNNPDTVKYTRVLYMNISYEKAIIDEVTAKELAGPSAFPGGGVNPSKSITVKNLTLEEALTIHNGAAEIVGWKRGVIAFQNCPEQPILDYIIETSASRYAFTVKDPEFVAFAKPPCWAVRIEKNKRNKIREYKG